MSEKITPEEVEAGLVRSAEVQEYTTPLGQTVKRAGVRDLKALRDDLNAEERVRSRGNILERTAVAAKRRG
ncbi:hypothetical protein [Desulfovibrio oxyclinae]|uniref:hypothetical protein n=1 Tax=Desulfovibrio oxyclinae TaxID=63560 RepID=UPI00038101B9|nr:hypothetical protein [Desulfovibrio oxyclinae]